MAEYMITVFINADIFQNDFKYHRRGPLLPTLRSIRFELEILFDAKRMVHAIKSGITAMAGHILHSFEFSNCSPFTLLLFGLAAQKDADCIDYINCLKSKLLSGNFIA
eukprot:1020202_1